MIGNGAFGLVYKGRVHGVGTDNVGWTMVAIKSPYGTVNHIDLFRYYIYSPFVHSYPFIPAHSYFFNSFMNAL